MARKKVLPTFDDLLDSVNMKYGLLRDLARLVDVQERGRFTQKNAHAMATMLTTIANLATKAAKMVQPPKKKPYIPTNKPGMYADIDIIINYEFEELMAMFALTEKNIHAFAARARRLAKLAHEFCAKNPMWLDWQSWSAQQLVAGLGVFVRYKHPYGISLTVTMSIDETPEQVPLSEKINRPDRDHSTHQFTLPSSSQPYMIYVKVVGKLGRYTVKDTLSHSVAPAALHTA
jgi:hypothetical protein